MKKVMINAEIRKFATLEIELTNEDYAALQTDSAIDVIGSDLDLAWEKADQEHNGVQYDYQLVDSEKNLILVDWNEDA